jgi:hypothetical protein
MFLATFAFKFEELSHVRICPVRVHSLCGQLHGLLYRYRASFAISCSKKKTFKGKYHALHFHENCPPRRLLSDQISHLVSRIWKASFHSRHNMVAG